MKFDQPKVTRRLIADAMQHAPGPGQAVASLMSAAASILVTEFGEEESIRLMRKILGEAELQIKTPSSPSVQ